MAWIRDSFMKEFKWITIIVEMICNHILVCRLALVIALQPLTWWTLQNIVSWMQQFAEIQCTCYKWCISIMCQQESMHRRWTKEAAHLGSNGIAFGQVWGYTWLILQLDQGFKQLRWVKQVNENLQCLPRDLLKLLTTSCQIRKQLGQALFLVRKICFEQLWALKVKNDCSISSSLYGRDRGSKLLASTPSTTGYIENTNFSSTFFSC